MAERDALGRRRAPGQDRGLRPLYPPLPPRIRSRSIRVAMSEWAWRRLDDLVVRSPAPTPPRAVGALLERAIWAAGERGAEVADWQTWQIRKERRLLSRSEGHRHREAAG